MADIPESDQLPLKFVVVKLRDGKDYESDFTANKSWNMLKLKIEIKRQHEIPGELTLWRGEHELRNKFDKCSKVLQPNDILRITFDNDGIFVMGPTAEGGKITGRNVTATGGYAEGVSVDKFGNVGPADGFGGSIRGTEGDEGRAGGATGSSAENVNRTAAGGTGFTGEIKLQRKKVTTKEN